MASRRWGITVQVLAIALAGAMAAPVAAGTASADRRDRPVRPGHGKPRPRPDVKRPPRVVPPPALPSGVNVYPSPPWVGPVLRDYNTPAVPPAQPPARSPVIRRHGVRPPVVLVPAPPPVIVVAPNAVPPAVVVADAAPAPYDTAAPEALGIAVAAIQRAWAQGDPAQLSAYLPDMGGVLLATAGGQARAVSPAAFLRAVGDTTMRATLGFQINQVEYVASGMARVTATHTYRDAAGATRGSRVLLLLQPQGARWVIIAADLGY